MKRNEGVADLIEQTGREEAEFIAVGSRHFSQITARPCIVLRCSRISYVVRKFVALLSDTVFITTMYRLFSRGGSCSALGPGHRLNTGSAAADRAALTALLIAFIPFFSSGARFDVFPRRRTGCSASLLRKGNAAHEERRDRAKRQPQRSTNVHEVFLPFYAPFTNVEAGHWLRLDPDN